MAEAGEGTEEPTPKRVEEARRRGEIAKSRDLGTAVGLVVFVGLTMIGGGSWLLRLDEYLRAALMGAVGDHTPLAAAKLAGTAAIGLLAPPLTALMLTAVLIGVAQTRGLWASEAIGFDPKRVMPSLARVWSLGALVETGKGLLIGTLLLATIVATFSSHLSTWTRLPGARPAQIVAALAAGGAALGLRLALLALALGVADFPWQWHRHRRSLLMTRDEVKREHKQSEGDPHHKGERQRLHRELLEQRMVADVRRADFVVVNPDHIAVAIRYDRDADEAPVVVAKGERLLAERIKQVAREAGVPIFREVMLARSLRDVEEGDPIPETLYEAVAEILRVVYGEGSTAAAVAAAVSDGNDLDVQKPHPRVPPAAHLWRRA